MKFLSQLLVVTVLLGSSAFAENKHKGEHRDLCSNHDMCEFDKPDDQANSMNECGHERAKMAVALNLGTALIGSFEASYLYKLNRRVALTASASWYDYRAALVRVFSKGYAPFLGVGGRVHLSGGALRTGLFVEPSLKLGYVIHPLDPVNSQGNVLSRIGVSTGYSHVFCNGLLLEGSAGMEQYYFFGRLSPTVGASPSLFRPVAQLSLGYAW